MEYSYLNLLQDVLQNGEERIDRTGTGTLSVFGRQMRFDLSKGFPAVTTKKLLFDYVASEELFFTEGSSDERRLAEILHGTRDESKKTIWTANANAPYWKPKAKFEGDLGRVYGVQWRDWQSYEISNSSDVIQHADGETYLNAKVKVRHIDQLQKVIDTIKNDPTDRRMIMTAMNVGELDQMALPPCHMFAQFYVGKGKLSCQVYLRSNDLFLGAPFNIAGYALTTAKIAHVTGLDVGELIITIGDAHIYLNHVEQVKEQVSRIPFESPTLWLNPAVKNINDFTMADIKLENYKHHPAIKGVMAV